MGIPTAIAEQASKGMMRKPTRPDNGEGCHLFGKRVTHAPTGSAGVLAAARMEEESGRNTGSPARWRGTRQPTAREGQVGPAGWRRGLKYRGCRVMPAEGRGLR